jgi:hypothetical protein
VVVSRILINPSSQSGRYALCSGAAVINSISARQILPLGPSLPVGVEVDRELAPGPSAPFNRTERFG